MTGYMVSRAFQVRSKRVAAVAATAQASATPVAGGIPVQVNAVQYVFTRLADIRPALLAAAVRDAKNRARVLLEAGGARLAGCAA